jgi:hypothetical protein
MLQENTFQMTCAFLEEYSRKTWDRIRFTRKLRGRISETTITENLLFDFWNQAAYNKLPIIIYEAKNEKANGNDLEIFIETPNGYLLVVCQAKIVNVKGKYASLFHKSGGELQLNLLIRYAEKFGAYPAYLFYNHLPFFLQSSLFQAITDERTYGITVAGAVPLYMMMDIFKIFGKSMRVPSFNDFHPHLATPLPRFICDLLSGRTDPGSFDLRLAKIQVRYYEDEDVRDEENWRRVLPPAQIGFVDLKKEGGRIEPERLLDNGSFNPKYRIVFSSTSSEESERTKRLKKEHTPKNFEGF